MTAAAVVNDFALLSATIVLPDCVTVRTCGMTSTSVMGIGSGGSSSTQAGASNIVTMAIFFFTTSAPERICR